MKPFQTVVSRTVVVPRDNIDTDQIIPARYLRGTTKMGLGKGLFADWRRDSEGHETEFILNKPHSRGAQVLVVGENFGCGSSREHAPWAIVDFGFRVVVSVSIADIFKNNAIKNGLLPVEVNSNIHRELLNQPGIMVTVDLSERTLALENGTNGQFPLDNFSRHCLLEGIDSLDYLLAHKCDITAFENRG